MLEKRYDSIVNRKRIKKVISFIITIILMFQNIMVVEAYTPYQSNALTYGSDKFSLDYVLGYFCINNSYAVGLSAQNNFWAPEVYPGIWYTTGSRTRNGSIYINHYDGAYMNGKYYDIREYVWIPDGGTMGVYPANGDICAYSANRCIREFHFYESGTLNSNNPIEVSFKGIMNLTDLDVDEGYTINNINRAYLTNPTNVKYVSNNTWLGTVDNSSTPQRDNIWAEVYGSSGNPLTITYWAAGTHGGSINFNSSNSSGKITYKANGGIGNDVYQIVAFGYNNQILSNPFTRTGYIFKGWNSRPDRTGTNYEEGKSYIFSSNATLYAQWELIVPTYTSNISYMPIDTYQNQYLKNRKVKINAIVENTNDMTYPELGLNNGIVTFNIDNGISLDRDTLKITYTNKEGTEKVIDYTLNDENTLTIDFGENKVSRIKDKIEIEIIGIANEIKEYNSNISLTGDLRAYNGENTTINLGELTRTEKSFSVQYQTPKARIQIEKVDSITEEYLNNATFTLYEWDVATKEYIEKETLTVGEEDGVYTSNYYEWNINTEGKYKVVETGVPESYKDLQFSMEYTIDQLKQDNYTITPDYDNEAYKIIYGVRIPDDFDKLNRIVENEPYKLKAKIEKIDSETKKPIVASAEFTIYEWDKETQSYKEYISYTNGQEVTMKRQEDGSYLTEEWLYYTSKNEGKYRIVETKAPEGYAANYGEDGEKVHYDINLIESIESGNYYGQPVENESTIIISDEEGKNAIIGKRVDTTLNLTVVDKETKSMAQADATLEGAKYGIYALEQINHADGVTSRYEGEPGVLYKKDELIATELTDEEGKITFENLECGIYYVKMIEAPEGYLLDETKYKIDCSYQGETKEHLKIEEQIEIVVKKQAFQLYKLKENQEVLSNAGFSIYLISDLSIVKTQKIARVTKDTYQLNDKQAESAEQLNGKQNEDGTYYLSDLIDYYYKIDFSEENKDTLPGDEEIYHPYRIQENFVKDYSTNIEGVEIEEIRTDGNGYMRSPELAYGEYIVLETSVPRKQQPVKSFLIKVQEDDREAQKLRVVIDKDFKTRVKIYIKDANTNNIIVDKTTSYVIKNEETGEYMTISQWNGTEFVLEGTMQNPFVIKEQGYFITPMELPIGKYIIEEINAPEGYIVNGKEGYAQGKEVVSKPKEKVRFEVASNSVYYMDHYLGNYIIAIEQENEEAVGNVTIKVQGEYSNKIEKADGSYQITYEIKDMANVEYDIYAAEDIYSQDNHKILRYQKDEKVATVATNEKAEAMIGNLPQGKYYIKQISKDEHFLEQEIQEIEIAYEGQETPVIFKTVEFIQRVTKLFIKIQDEETKEMPDAIVEIKDKDGKVVASTEEKEGIIKIIKTEEGYYVEGLPVGEYEIQEITPNGYKTIEAQKINVKNTKEKQEMILTTRKLIFDVGIEKKLKNIIINEEVTNVANSNGIMKVEIKERKIKTTELKLQYSIIVTNKGEIEATVEKIVDKMPQGLVYEEEGSGNWKVNKQEAIYEETIVLQPGESKEIPITLKWEKNANNFGEKKNTAELLEVTNQYGYKNRSNGVDSESVVISVGTGLEKKITIVRIIIITFTTCMVICLMAAIEIAIIKRKGNTNP